MVNQSNAGDQSIEMHEKWRLELQRSIRDQEERFRTGKRRWNLWYYTSMYGAVLLSALSALVLKIGSTQIKGERQSDVAALLATFAAILGTVSSVGNFERRWSASRQARTEMQSLDVDIQNPKADLKSIAAGYKIILQNYQNKVVGNDA